MRKNSTAARVRARAPRPCGIAQDSPRPHGKNRRFRARAPRAAHRARRVCARTLGPARARGGRLRARRRSRRARAALPAAPPRREPALTARYPPRCAAGSLDARGSSVWPAGDVRRETARAAAQPPRVLAAGIATLRRRLALTARRPPRCAAGSFDRARSLGCYSGVLDRIAVVRQSCRVVCVPFGGRARRGASVRRQRCAADRFGPRAVSRVAPQAHVLSVSGCMVWYVRCMVCTVCVDCGCGVYALRVALLQYAVYVRCMVSYVRYVAGGRVTSECGLCVITVVCRTGILLVLQYRNLHCTHDSLWSFRNSY
jgi:hypothetical protein